jgi:glycosyltransferase involved in cell wall biosynthesis
VRLALFCNDYWPTIGGVQTAVRGLAQALRRRGHEPLVLTCQPGGCPVEEELDGIPVRRIAWSLRPQSTFPVRAWRARREVREAVRGWKPDALYVHFVTVPGLFAWACAPKPRVPLVLSFRGAEVMQLAPRSAATRRVYALLTAAADVNLFCSPWLERVVEGSTWFRGRPDRSGVLADAVVVEPRTTPEPAAQSYVFAAGRMVSKKGFDILLRAWARLRGRIDLPLWIAGDGEERPALERLAKELELGERVRFLGAVPHPEMLGLLECAALCVVPSREEPYGILVVEAQALGVPVVASAVGNLPQLIEDGRTGFLAEPTDEGLARAIGAAWEDPRRCEVGRAGREAPGARRGYDVMAGELEEWIRVARSERPKAGSWT